MSAIIAGEVERPTGYGRIMTDCIKGQCHCGAVTVEVAAQPPFINACNCGWCGKLGVWWGYYAPADVRVMGETKGYTRTDKAEPAAEAHFCPSCGVTTHWQRPATYVAKHGPAEMLGVNMRLFERDALRGVQLLYPDGRNWSGTGPWDFVREGEIL